MKKLFSLFILSITLFVYAPCYAQVDGFNGIATGTNTYAATVSAYTNTSYVNAMKLRLKFANANSGASTINVNSIGAKAVTISGSALSGGEIPSGVYITFIYDGASQKWQMQPYVAGSGGSSAWKLTGNSGTVAGTNFLGTADSIDFITKTNGIERMRVLANGGKVGIGTATPNNLFHVKDYISFVDTLETISIGYLAGNANTGVSQRGVEGNENIFIGYKAGRLAKNQIGSIYIGNHCGEYDTMLYNGNTCIGAQVLNNCYSCVGNVLIGQDVMSDGSTSGNDNTIVGYRAGYSQNGNSNSAFGSNSLGGAITPSNLCAFGLGALNSCVNATGSSAFGYGALRFGSGDANTAIGSESQFSSRGSNNTAIGFKTLYTDASTGSNNVMIGYAAAYHGTNHSNTFIIDAIFRVDSLRQVNKSLLYGKFSSDSSLQALRVNVGTLTLPYLGAGANKIMTSDASGNATWSSSINATSLIIDSLTTKQEASAIDSAGVINIPADKSGWGNVFVFNAGAFEEYGNFHFQSDGVVTLITNSANTVTTNTGGKLCIFDAGTNVTIKNNLGNGRIIKLVIHY